MMAAETRRVDFENGRSVLPNNTCMLCGRISDSGLYWFCYRRVAGTLRMIIVGLRSNDGYGSENVP